MSITDIPMQQGKLIPNSTRMFTQNIVFKEIFQTNLLDTYYYQQKYFNYINTYISYFLKK